MQVNSLLSKLLVTDSDVLGSDPSNAAPNPSAQSNPSLKNPNPGVVVKFSAQALASANPVGAAATPTLTVAKFLSTRNSIVGTVNIVDTAANIAKNIDALNNAASLSKIGTMAQTGVPSNLAITYSQWQNDRTAAALPAATSVLTKLAFDTAGTTNRIIVNQVPDASRTNVTTADARTLVGVEGVSVADIDARIADTRISSIGFSNVLGTDLSLYASKFANAKVTALNVVGIASSGLSAVLANNKVKGVTVINTLAKDVGSLAANPRVTGISISDSSLNITRSYATILSRNDKIANVVQTGVPADISMTAAQYTASTSLLAKFTGSYTVSLTSVKAADVATVANDSKVTKFAVNDTGINIVANLSAMTTNLAKMDSLIVNGNKSSPLNLTAAQYFGSNIGAFTAGASTGWTTGAASGAGNTNVTFTTSTNANSASAALPATLDVSASAPNVAIAPGINNVSNALATITFKPLAAGQTLTIAGLTFTAGASGATAAQIASAFASVPANTAIATINGNPKNLGDAAGGSFTAGPSSSSWLSGAVTGATTVTFTTTSNVGSASATLTPVIDASASNPTTVVSPGVNNSTNATAAVTFKALAAGQKLTMAGLTFTAGSAGATAAQVASAFASITPVGTLATSLNAAKNYTTAAASLLQKIPLNTYTINLSGVASSALSQVLSNTAVSSIGLSGVAVADLTGDVVNSSKVKTIQVADTAANVVSGLATLKNYTTKITQIGNSTNVFMPEVAFTPAQYDAKLVNKFSGFSIAVNYTGPAANYSVGTDALGNRTITNTTNSTKTQFANNVNFFKFQDKNLFGTTGNKNVDSVLLGVTKNWWFDPAQATPGAQQGSVVIGGGITALGANSSKHTLTYSFLDLASITGASNSAADLKDFAAMNATQQNAVKAALEYISTVTNITFTPAAAGAGDLNFGTNNQGVASAAYAYNPNTADHINIMLNSQSSTNNDFTQGSYGWETLIHEIAHSLGLKHPGNYNAGGGGAIGPYLPAGDAGSRRYSIMSYNNPADAQNVTNLGGGNYSLKGLNPSTFMGYDIAALQFLYGVNTTATQNVAVGASIATESAAVTFKPLAAGQTLSLAGLTFTAGTSGATAAQLASAFASIPAGTQAATINGAPKNLGNSAGGTFTAGPSANWTTGVVSNSTTVTFTSTSANSDVSNLKSSLALALTNSAPSIVLTQGVASTSTESAVATFKDMVAGQALTMGGLTFTAGASGATAAQVASAFASISAGTAAASINAAKVLGDSAGGIFTAGKNVAWSTGPVSGLAVTFTSTTTNADVADLVAYSGTLQAPDIVTTGGVKNVDDFQKANINSGWYGFESLYIPSAVTNEELNLSALTNSNIVDLRGGAFSSINILPPSTKTNLPTVQLKNAQTYFGLNNVSLAYGTQINEVAGGAGADAYYVSDYNVRIRDLSAGNTVYLSGVSSDWVASNPSVGTTVYTNSQTAQTVTLSGGEFKILYYNPATTAGTHSLLNLTA